MKGCYSYDDATTTTTADFALADATAARRNSWCCHYDYYYDDYYHYNDDFSYHNNNNYYLFFCSCLRFRVPLLEDRRCPGALDLGPVAEARAQNSVWWLFALSAQRTVCLGQLQKAGPTG